MSNHCIVVVANRLPIDETKSHTGVREWRRSPGGLVSALHPVLRDGGATWVGWAGCTGTAPELPDVDGVGLRAVSLSDEDFEDYYSSAPAAAFASQVFTNNVRVAIFAFAGGIAFCLLTAGILLFNGAQVGLAAGLFAAVGQSPKFWGLILPHGLLELTAVCVAGGAGLRLGWTLIDPGDRPRATALVEEGRRAMAIVLGLVVVFAVRDWVT